MNKWRLFYNWERSDWIFVKSSIKQKYNHNLIGKKHIHYRYMPKFPRWHWTEIIILERYTKKAVRHHPWRRPKGSENLNPIFSVLLDHNQPKKVKLFPNYASRFEQRAKKCQNIYFWKNQYFSHLAQKWINGGFSIIGKKLRMDIC